jgi:hypothetical protein
MRHNSDRTITVEKAKLIKQIKDNKAKHLVDYEEAVIAYRKKAQEAIDKQQQDLIDGKFTIGISLVAPVNKSEEYDKLVTQFDWEVNDKVELSQSEFNEYVLDETHFAVQARLMNSSYK